MISNGIHKEGGGKKEEEGLKRYDNDGGNTGEGEEREGAKSLEDASNNDEIYNAIASRGTTTTNAKAAKDGDDEEGRIMGILQFWVCAMGHMEAATKLIMERGIYCI